MRTPEAIRAKINEYLEKLDRSDDPESVCHVLDALLWVIEDSSGAPI